MASLTIEQFSRSSKLRSRLRVGVLLDSLVVPRWTLHLLEAIENSPVADLAVVVTSAAATSDRPEKLENGLAKTLRLWLELDRHLFAHRSANPGVNAPVPFEPTNGCLVLQNPSDCHFSDRALTQLRSMQLDILLNLASSAPASGLPSLAKYGVCWFSDDAQLTKDSFRWLSDETVIESTINVDSSQYGPAIIPACYSPADKYSFFRNFGVAAEKRSSALRRYLAEIECEGRLPNFTVRGLQNVSGHTSPGNLETLGLILRLIRRMLRDQYANLLRREDWFIAFRKARPQRNGSSGLEDFTLLRPPAGHLYADPFVIDKNGSSYIFFEDYCHTEKRGVISFVVVSDAGCSFPEVALEEDYHLSFPSLFEWNGEIYLLPESKNNQNVQLYRAVDFPHRWELSRVLLQNISAVDSSLLRYDDKFWLFTCGLNSRDPWFAGDGELFLFSADSLNGPWAAHPKNPIVADVRDCRSAGQIMRWGKQLIRPAQDCSHHYGGAVVFNRIDVLSDNNYRETPVAKISPNWLAGNQGTHTFNRSQTCEVLDGRTLASKLWPGRSEPQFEPTKLMRSLLSPFGPSGVAEEE